MSHALVNPGGGSLAVAVRLQRLEHAEAAPPASH
jgi:hypothetical protein